MQTLTDLFWRAAAHPIGWIIIATIVWELVSGVLNVVLFSRLPRSEQEWADLTAKSPRLAAAADLLKSAGWNIPGAIDALRRLFSGGIPRWLLHPGGGHASKEQLEAIAKKGAEEAIAAAKKGALYVQPVAGEPVVVLPSEAPPPISRLDEPAEGGRK